jgi:hypothetical protein
MHVGRDCIRANAHNRGDGVLMRQQAVHGPRRNALLDNPTHAEYKHRWRVFGWFHGHGPVQVTGCAKKRRLVSEDNIGIVIGIATSSARDQICDLAQIASSAVGRRDQLYRADPQKS